MSKKGIKERTKEQKRTYKQPKEQTDKQAWKIECEWIN